MTQIDIISGFLGAGKTTLIKKLLSESFQGQKNVLIENEFGEIGIDGGFLKDAGVEITEMNSGCICCSLVGDFGAALKKVLEDYSPDRIIIEPSGVGKLSDVIAAVERVQKGVPGASAPQLRHRGGRHQGPDLHEELRRVLQQPGGTRLRHSPLPHPEHGRGQAERRRQSAARQERQGRHSHHTLGPAHRGSDRLRHGGRPLPGRGAHGGDRPHPQ